MWLLPHIIMTYIKKNIITNYKNYTACLETLGQAINPLRYMWKNLFPRAIYHPRSKYSLKGLQLVETLILNLHAKNKIYSSLLFWDIVKILQTCYFKYCEKAWPCPSVMIVSACRKLCWNQFVGKIDVYLHAKNQLHL